ncbi:MAG: hypothetical protein NT129_03605 [Candidatus Aenigmarchaeota archaeon]|nr:hypothetical protein [Candidatus Aenigmarchaeota archaeon]
MKKIMIIFIAVILLSGCIEQEQEKEIKSITIPGHGQQVYEFSYDIKKSLAVYSNDPASIKGLVWNSSKINIVFNGSNEDDNAYFRVVLINTINKLQAFFAYEGKLIDYDTFYFVDWQWYNKSIDKINKTEFSDTVIWLVGPNTGAKETAVNIEGNIIYIQGTSYENLVLAGDKFALIVMGIERIKE